MVGSGQEVGSEAKEGAVVLRTCTVVQEPGADSQLFNQGAGKT